MTTRLDVRVDREKDRVLDLKAGNCSYFRISPALFEEFEAAGEDLSLKVTRVSLYDEWIQVYPRKAIVLTHHHGETVLGLSKDIY